MLRVLPRLFAATAFFLALGFLADAAAAVCRSQAYDKADAEAFCEGRLQCDSKSPPEVMSCRGNARRWICRCEAPADDDSGISVPSIEQPALTTGETSAMPTVPATGGDTEWEDRPEAPVGKHEGPSAIDIMRQNEGVAKGNLGTQPGQMPGIQPGTMGTAPSREIPDLSGAIGVLGQQAPGQVPGQAPAPAQPVGLDSVVPCGANAMVQVWQLSFVFDDGRHDDTSWGRATVSYLGDPAYPVRYFNLMLGDDWAVRDLPLRGGDVDDPIDLNVWTGLGVADGTPVASIEYGCNLTNRPIGAPPEKEEKPAKVNPDEVVVATGILGGKITYKGPQTDMTWWSELLYVEAAFHPWASIINQECGKDECFPAAVSNSLKMLKKSFPKKMKGLTDIPGQHDDTDINKLKRLVGWNPGNEIIESPGGIPQGPTNDPKAGWSLKKDSFDKDPRYPIKTEFVDDPKKLDRVIAVVRARGDCEFIGGHHAVMVTGALRLKDGTYLFEVADDTKQGEAGGTQVRVIKYDPKANKFTGDAIVAGLAMKKGQGQPLFVCETVQ